MAPLLLTVRFSTPHPDVDLNIPSPETTPTAALKLLIRAQLPEPDSRRRLRFIYRGRILDDNAALAAAVRPLSVGRSPLLPPPPPPPPRRRSHGTTPSGGGGRSGHAGPEDDGGRRRDGGVEDEDEDDDDDSDSGDEDEEEEGTAAHRRSGAEAEAEAASSAQPKDITRMRRRRRRRRTREKGKGKATTEDDWPSHSASSRHEAARVIINCAIGNEESLTPTELAAESVAAHQQPSPPSHLSSHLHLQRAPSTTGPGPRGFDRLLAAGLDPAEISQLRAQFRAVQARRFTPDTMPSPDAMRRLEDAWIDAGAGGTRRQQAATALLLDGDGDGGNDAAGAEEVWDGWDGPDDGFGMVASMMDGVLRGLAVGYFFPVGSMVWVVREHGMLSQQWGVYVMFGLFLAVTTGVMRGFAGESEPGKQD